VNLACRCPFKSLNRKSHRRRDVLGARYDSLVKAVSYEVTDPTIDSQVVALRTSNADVLISGVTAKFAAQAIRKVYELDWKPMHFVTSGAASVASTIMPVGAERAVGVITSVFIKDPSDPGWAEDAAIKDYMKVHGEVLRRGKPEGSAQRLCLHGHFRAAHIA
jgi:branched-chain amino acid transport system substrate-binding protein